MNAHELDQVKAQLTRENVIELATELLSADDLHELTVGAANREESRQMTARQELNQRERGETFVPANDPSTQQ